MELTKKQFDVLVTIEKNNNVKLSQRDIANNTNISVGLVNKIINELLTEKLIDENNSITKKGLEALESKEPFF